jgi:hypothetical protein
VVNALGEKATTTNLDLKAPMASPTFTGTATAAALTVSGALLVGTTNVASALNLKANASDTYTKTQVANSFQSRINSFGSPLRFDLNILTANPTLSIEETATLTIGDIESSGTLSIDTIEAQLSDHIQVNSNFTVAGNLSANGNIDIDGSITCADIKGRNRPFFGLYIAANGTILANVGQVQTGITVYVAPSNAYAITYTTPHPLGDNYIIMAMSRTTSKDSAFAVCTGYGTATTLNVWNRTAANAIIMSPFFVYSVP